MSISPDGHTGILIGGANGTTDEMVKAVDDLKGELTAASTDSIEVYPTGASALWSDFNKANHDAMIKAEIISWPVTLAIMVLAFGSLVAAGLPLLLTLAGLVASAGGPGSAERDHADLGVGHELCDDVRAGARYRLRAVPRRAIPGCPAEDDRRRTNRLTTRGGRKPWIRQAKPSCCRD